LSKLNPLIDLDFLKRLDTEKEREVFAKVIALDWDENPLEEITGRVTGGSVNIDGTSAVRRTCSVSLVAEELNIHDYYWGLNSKFKLSVGLKNRIDERYPDIIWFPQGTYAISSFSTSQSTNSYSVSIQGKDKMCLLNGELGGIVNSLTWDFGSYDEISADGTLTNKKYLLKEIIIEAVHEFAKEPYHNIIVNDLDTFGVELMEYRGKDPMYLLVNQESLEVSQMTTDGNTTYPKWKRELDSGWKTKNVKLRELESVDTLEDAAYDTGTDRLSVTTNHVLLQAANGTVYSVIKAEYGTVVGYRVTDLTYAGDLIAQVGNPITTAVLDKIKSMLGEFEYFYDLDGRFIFQKKKTYISTSYNGSNTNDDNDSWFDNVAESSAITYFFEDAQIISSFSNQPNLANLRNDFSIWGVRKSISGNEIPVHMRYAIDRKPVYYKTYNGEIFTTKDIEEVMAIPEKSMLPPVLANGEYEGEWWDIHDWAEQYKGLTGEFPNGIMGTYGNRTCKIDLNKYFPPGTKWDANRPLFLFEVNADGTLGNTGHNPSRDGGKPINSCTAHYYSYFTDRAQNGIRSYIYDPTIPQGVKIIYNKVEWREIIYQMAKDHMSNGHKDNFEAVLAENNRDYYPTGQTGYEQYYTDIISFWRDIYDPSYSNGYEKIHVTKNTFNKEKSKYWELVRCVEDTPYADRIWLKKTGVNATNKDKAYDFVNMDAYIWNNKLLPKEKTYYYYLQQCNNSSIFKSGSEYYIKIEDEFTVQEDENGVVNGWSKEVSQYPEMLNFWFDFLDARDGDLDKYCVQNVGIRPKAENDTNVKAIYFRDTPNVIFVDTTKISKGEKDKLISKYGSEQEWLIYIRDNLTDEEKKQYTGNALQTYIESKQALELKLAVDENIRVQREEMPGYTFIRMPTYMENQFSISAQGKSAFDKLDNWLYTYACCTESISISALPVYYLNPNTRIFVKDTNSGIEGEYIVSRISLPLTYNGMMSISATKAVQRLY
jgi:hypothetical protein